MAQGTDLEQKMALAGQTVDGKAYVGRIPDKKDLANAKYGEHASNFTVHSPEVQQMLNKAKMHDAPTRQPILGGFKSLRARAEDPTDLSAYEDETKSTKPVVVPYTSYRQYDRERELV
jgi:hypothetical protein